MTHNQIEYEKLKETQRSNQAQEYENARWHDMSNELGYAQLAETARGNSLNYEVGMANVAQHAQQAEWTHQENITKNAISAQELTVHKRQQQETTRSNVAKESETVRHQQTQEELTTRGQNLGLLGTVIQVGGSLVGKLATSYAATK